MDENITYMPLFWHYFREDEGWYLVRDRKYYLQKVYGPFPTTEEAHHAGEIWGVPFQPETAQVQ